jgi:hypothetical protein
MPPESSGDPAAPARRPRRWRRVLLRGFLFALVLVALAAVALIRLPLPLPGLSARVEASLSALVGFAVRIDSASLWLYDRRLVIRGLHGAETASGVPLSIEEIDANLRWQDWRVWKSPPEFLRVQVRGVRGANLVCDPVGVALAPSANYLFRWPEDGKGRGIDLDALHVPALTISDASLTISEKRPAGAVALFACDGLSCELFPTPGGTFRLARWEGVWQPAAGGQHPFDGGLERTDAKELTLGIHLEGFDTQEMVPLPADVHLVGRSLTLHSLIDLTPGAFTVDTNLSGDRVAWAIAPGKLNRRLAEAASARLRAGQEQPSIHFRLRQDAEGKRWVLEESDLSLAATRLTAEGEIRQEPGWPMELHLSAEHAPVGLLMLDAFVNRYGVAINKGSLALDLRVEGPAMQPRLLASRGRLTLTDGEILLGAPVAERGTDFRGTVDFVRDAASEEFRVAGLGGRVGSLAVEIPSASLIRRGDSEGTHYDATIAFGASGELADCAKHLPQIASLNLAAPPTGAVAIEGTLRQTIRPRRPGTQTLPEIPQIEGTIHLSDVDAVLADEKGTISVARAAIRFTADSLRLRDTDVDCNDQTLSVSGSVRGQRFFWESPTLEAHVRTVMGAETLIAHLPPSLAALPQEEAPTGAIAVRLDTGGPLTAPESWRRSVTLSPRDLVVPYAAGPERGHLEVVGGEVEVSPEAMAIRDLSARLNGLPVALNGQITPRRVELDASAHGDARRAREALPHLLDMVILGGPAEAHLSFRTALNAPDDEVDPHAQGLTNPRVLAEIGRQLREQFSAWAAGADDTPIRIGGHVNFEDCEVTPIGAPASVEVIHVRGLASWDGRLFRAGGIQAQMGVNENCVIRDLEFDPRIPQHLSMTIEGPEADLTEWVLPWHHRGWGNLTRAERRSRVFDHGNPNRVMVADITVRSPRLRWHNLVGEDGEAHIRHEFRRADRLTKLDVDVTRLTAYGGSGEGTYHLIMLDEGSTQVAHLNVQNVDLEPLLRDLRDRPDHQAEGRLSGEIGLRVEPDETWGNVHGEGHLTLTESSIMRSTIFAELARLTGIQRFNDISFSNVAADVRLADHRVNVQDLVMNTTWTTITGAGTVGFDGALNFNLELDILRSVFTAIPGSGLIPGGGWIMGLADYALNRVLMTVRVAGSLERPSVELRQPILSPLIETIVPG